MPAGSSNPAGDVTLEYAPCAPVRRSRRRRWAFRAVLLLFLASLAFWFGPALWKRGRTAFVTRQAGNYTMPADQVVYEDDPSTSRPLFPIAVTATTAPSARVTPDPPILSRLAGITANPGTFQLFAPRGPGEPLAFLHERRTHEGNRFLVALRITGLTYYPSDGGTLACTYTALLLQPNGTYPPTQVSLVRAWGGVHIPTNEEISARRPSVLTRDPAAPPAPGRVRVYFGAADPANDSSFTIPYEVNGRRKQWHFRVSKKGIDLDEQDPATTVE